MWSIITTSMGLSHDRWLIVIGVFVTLSSFSTQIGSFDLPPVYAGTLFFAGILLAALGTFFLVKKLKSDVTTAQQHSEMFQQVIARQQTFLDLHDSAYYEANSLGHVTFVNRAYTTLAGRSSLDLLGAGWITTIEQEDRERVVADWRHAISDCRQFESEYYLRRSDGDTFLVTNEGVPLKIGESVFGYSGIVEALSEEEE